MISKKSNFKTASEAFDYFYIKIKDKALVLSKSTPLSLILIISTSRLKTKV